MKKHQPKFGALHTPQLFAFLHGFSNGRFHTAGVDADTGLLTGAFISGKTAAYDAFCKNRVAALIEELIPVREEANARIMEYRALPPIGEAVTMPEEPVYIPPQTMEQSRAGRAAAAAFERAAAAAKSANEERTERIARRSEILCTLRRLLDSFTRAEQLCRGELAAAACDLTQTFCVYGHGVCMRPVRTVSIPRIEYEPHLAGFCADLQPLKNNISAILAKEEIK